MTEHPVADLHAHTIASGHAYSTLDELARAAATAGLTVLGVTDHGPSMTGAPTHGYFEMAHRLPPVLHGVRVLFGCESNIVDHTGRIDIEEEWQPAQGVLLAGLHARSPYPRDSDERQNTDAVIGAIQNPAIHIISHPYRERMPVDPAAVADAACRTGTLLEVNLSVFIPLLALGDDLGGHPVVRQTRVMVEKLLGGGGEFVLGSDAHHASELAGSHSAAAAVCRLLGVPPGAAVNYRAERLAAALPALAE